MSTSHPDEHPERDAGVKLIRTSERHHITLARELFSEYSAAIGVDLSYQGFAGELEQLPGNYAAPRGALFLAMVDGEAAGCIALRPFRDDAGEVKRLYVRPAFRQHGLGAKLCSAIVAEAREIGYRTLLLDTLPTMTGAIRLYESHGFAKCAAYYETPLENTVFMRLDFP